jgi:hypothetical protein
MTVFPQAVERDAAVPRVPRRPVWQVAKHHVYRAVGYVAHFFEAVRLEHAVQQAVHAGRGHRGILSSTIALASCGCIDPHCMGTETLGGVGPCMPRNVCMETLGRACPPWGALTVRCLMPGCNRPRANEVVSFQLSLLQNPGLHLPPSTPPSASGAARRTIIAPLLHLRMRNAPKPQPALFRGAAHQLRWSCKTAFCNWLSCQRGPRFRALFGASGAGLHARWVGRGTARPMGSRFFLKTENLLDRSKPV